jgi:hypothetical protein
MIKWQNAAEQWIKSEQKEEIIEENNQVASDFMLNMHPSGDDIMDAVIDLIIEYKWESVIVIYSESLGPERVRKLVELPSDKIKNKKFRIQVKQLCSHLDNWAYLMKDVALSGSSHVIVDIERKYYNDFVKIVTIFSILFRHLLILIS